MAIKLNSMTEREIESIAEAFAEYQYEDGEEGLFFLFPDQEAIKIYLRAFVRAGVKAGWVYTTSERREGYLMISDSRSKVPVSALLVAIGGCLKALGLRGALALTKALKSGGESLEPMDRRIGSD